MKKMNKLFVLVMLPALLLLAVYDAKAGGGKTKPEDAAVMSAQNWLKIVDSGEYGPAWDQAAEYFKNAVSKENFEESLRGVRRPLGKVMKRSLDSAKYTKTLPGAPDGEYVVIQFKTEFENKRKSVETITPQKEKDGLWKVSGYYIK